MRPAEFAIFWFVEEKELTRRTPFAKTFQGKPRRRVRRKEKRKRAGQAPPYKGLMVKLTGA
jgi:hypothetical protein